MNKREIIEKFCAEFSRTNFGNPFKSKLLPYDSLAKSLGLKMWHGEGFFEFRTKGFRGRLIAKVTA